MNVLFWLFVFHSAITTAMCASLDALHSLSFNRNSFLTFWLSRFLVVTLTIRNTSVHVWIVKQDNIVDVLNVHFIRARNLFICSYASMSFWVKSMIMIEIIMVQKLCAFGNIFLMQMKVFFASNSCRIPVSCLSNLLLLTYLWRKCEKKYVKMCMHLHYYPKITLFCCITSTHIRKFCRQAYFFGKSIKTICSINV